MSRTTRKPFTGSKAIDSSCRSHGNCPWCGSSRKHKNMKRQPVQDADISDLVRRWIRQNFLSMKAAAADLDVSPSFLSQVQCGKKAPTREILKRMGLTKQRTYQILRDELDAQIAAAGKRK